MTLDDTLRDLAGTGNELPRNAMQWALDHWDDAGPRLVALLDAYACGRDRSEATARALFFGIHLLGDKAETAAFAPLCRVLLDAEASDLILGDAITTTLPGILISTYDGDLATLQAVICQRMVPKIGGGVVPALEILINTGTVKKMIEENRLDKLAAAIETSQDYGMQSFNQALFNLVKERKVTEKDALAYATNAQALEMNFKGIFLDEGRRILS